MKPLGPQDVISAMKTLGLDNEVTEYQQSTATSELAAEAIGTTVSQIAKSIVFMVDGDPIVVITSGDKRIDDKKLAKKFEVGRKKVKIAKPEQCIEFIGYAPGGVAPFGHRTEVPIYIDESLAQYDVIYAAAGSPNHIFPIKFATLVEKTNGDVIDVIKETS